MDTLQDHLIYPAELTLQVGAEPLYQVQVRTQREVLHTTGNSLDKVQKMASSVLIDMSYAMALEDTLPPAGHFVQNSKLYSRLKSWLKLYRIRDLKNNNHSNDCELSFIKSSYLAQLINLQAVAHLDSANLLEQTQQALDVLLDTPLSNCPEQIDPQNLSKPLALAKEPSILYLLARLYTKAQQSGDDQLLQAVELLSKVANKRINLPLKPNKLKTYHQELKDEVAVLIPLSTALKFILCNSILEHRVKLRNLAEDLHIGKEQLEEQLNFYNPVSIQDLLLIFSRLGLNPDLSF